MSREALGLIETKGMLGAIEVTRAATHAAEVSIASAEHTESGRVIVKIEGDWETVAAAVEAGARAAEQAEQLVSIHLIPRPDESVSPILPYRLFVDRYFPTAGSAAPARRLSQPTPAARDSAPRLARTTGPKSERQMPKPTPKSSSSPKAVSARIDSSNELPAVEPKPRPQPSPPAKLDHPPNFEELEALPVVKLRQYARTLTNLPIQGRQISMANKQQLLEAIKATQ